MKVKYALFYTHIGSGWYSTNYYFFDSLDDALSRKDKLLSSGNINDVLLFEFKDFYSRLGRD